MIMKVLGPHDCFVWNANSDDDGPLIYVEILRFIHPGERLVANAGSRYVLWSDDVLGDSAGYLTRVYCADEVSVGAEGAEDFYSWDLVDDFISDRRRALGTRDGWRLSHAQMAVAKKANWPRSITFLNVIGIRHRTRATPKRRKSH